MLKKKSFQLFVFKDVFLYMWVYTNTHALDKCVGENVVTRKNYSKLFIARDSRILMPLDCFSYF